jgi:hypothetical protein
MSIILSMPHTDILSCRQTLAQFSPQFQGTWSDPANRDLILSATRKFAGMNGGKKNVQDCM